MLNNIKANGYYYSLLLLSFTMPFKLIISNILIMFLIIIWITGSSLKAKLSLLKEHKIGLLFISVFFLYCFGLLYSENIRWGLFQIEKVLMLLIFPLIFFSSPKLSSKHFDNILKAFIAGVLTASVTAVLYAIYRRFITKSLSAFELNNFYIEIPHIYMTHVYFGMYLVLALYFTVYLYIKLQQRTMTDKFVAVLIISFLTTLVFTSGSFMSFISLVISAIAFLSMYFAKKYKGYSAVFAFILMAGVISALIYSDHPSINRYKQRIFLSFEHVENNQYNYSSTRVGPLVVGLDVAKDYWLWGVGTGDTDTVMEKQYIQNNLDKLVYLNTHNQYLDFLITFGVFGLCLLLASLLYPLYLSIKKRLFLYSFFLILILLCSVTENILATNKGIILYSFFNAILAHKLYYSRKVNYGEVKVLEH